MKKLNAHSTKKLLSFLLCAALTLTLFAGITFPAKAALSGYCGKENDGKNLVCTLYDDGRLVITGQGEMMDFDTVVGESGEFCTNAPWGGEYLKKVKQFIVQSGPTSIGNYALYGCPNLTSVTIGDKVTKINQGAFANCPKLTSVTIPNNVTSVGASLFYNCTGLNTATLGTGLEKIPGGMFRDCESLTSVSIPRTVKTIQFNAFNGCIALKEINYNGSKTQWEAVTVDNEGNDALKKATVHYNGGSILASGVCGDALTWTLTYSDLKLTVSGTGKMYEYDSKTVDGKERTTAPWGWQDVRSVEIGSGVTYVGAYAFCGCQNLTSAKFSDSVTTIGRSVFMNCTALTSVSLPKSMSNLNVSVFQGCSALTEITIPDGVKILAMRVFNGCTALKTITIPTSVKTVGANAFLDCSKLTVVFYKGTSTDWSAISINATGNDPLKNAGRYYNCAAGGVCGSSLYWYLMNTGSLRIIGYGDIPNFEKPDLSSPTKNKAPWGWEDVKEIVVTDDVTGIGDYAFTGCSNATSVTIREGAKKIGKYAFAYCTGLTSVTIPASVTTIDEQAFFLCGNLSSIVITKGLQNVNDNAFNACLKLKDVYFTGTEEEWKAITVSDTGNDPLKNARIFYNYTPGTFFKCGDTLHWSLDENGVLTISGTGKMYDYSTQKDAEGVNRTTAPWGTEYVRQVVVESGATVIGKNAFCGCENLTSAEIADSVTNLGQGTFTGCTALTSVKLPSKLEKLDIGVFQNCSSLASIDIPDKVAEIQISAFRGCTNLESVTLPESVINIYTFAFAECTSLSYVVMPAGVHFIARQAFYKSAALKDVYYGSTEEDWNSINIGSPNDDLLAATIHYAAEKITVTDGVSNRPYASEGETVTVTANAAPEGKQFDKWEVVKGGVTLKDPANPESTFIMGKEPVEIKATYKDVVKYNVTVTNGTADPAKAAKGATVTITAAAAPEGKTFDKWVVVSGGVTLKDETKATTTFVMGDKDVEIKATYKDAGGAAVSLGDVDGDGQITSADARLALRRAVDLETFTKDTREYKAADVDKDGQITSADARKILRAAVELEDPKTW